MAVVDVSDNALKYIKIQITLQLGSSHNTHGIERFNNRKKNKSDIINVLTWFG